MSLISRIFSLFSLFSFFLPSFDCLTGYSNPAFASIADSSLLPLPYVHSECSPILFPDICDRIMGSSDSLDFYRCGPATVGAAWNGGGRYESIKQKKHYIKGTELFCLNRTLLEKDSLVRSLTGPLEEFRPSEEFLRSRFFLLVDPDLCASQLKNRSNSSFPLRSECTFIPISTTSSAIFASLSVLVLIILGFGIHFQFELRQSFAAAMESFAKKFPSYADAVSPGAQFPDQPRYVFAHSGFLFFPKSFTSHDFLRAPIFDFFRHPFPYLVLPTDEWKTLRGGEHASSLQPNRWKLRFIRASRVHQYFHLYFCDSTDEFLRFQRIIYLLFD